MSKINQQLHKPIVLNTIIVGTGIFLCIIMVLLSVSYVGLHNSHVLARLVIAICLLGYVLACFALLQAQRVKLTALLMLGLYGFLAVISAVLWSITAPFALLMFAFFIVMAGVTLGSSYAFIASAIAVCALGLIQEATSTGWINPDRNSVMLPPNFGDVAGFGTVFFVLGMISWLAGRQSEQALDKALKAESALQHEKDLLAQRLEERTQKLRTAQLQEMQQLYRFAELGQLSTALLHDLANHLTVLTLNIEDIDKSQHSSALKRAKKSIMYLDGMVDQVRSQLQGSSRSAMFSVPEKINETSKLLSDKLTFTNVKIELITQHDSKKLVCLGDPIRFQQIMTILISNSIDAYKGIRKINGHAAVRIHVKSVQRSIVISIQDDGIGISDSARHNLFKPFYSTKKEGMGIGLFIAKQMVETHFKGEIAITDTDSFTEFVVSLPKAYTRGAKKT